MSLFNLFGRKSQENDPQAESAYDQGRQAGEALFAAVEAWLDSRLPGLEERYLNILRGQLAKAAEFAVRDGVSPEHSARLEYQVFLGQVEDLGAKLDAEIGSNLHDWLGVADQLGVREQIDQYVRNRIVSAQDRLTFEGADMSGARIQELRKANPPLP